MAHGRRVNDVLPAPPILWENPLAGRRELPESVIRNDRRYPGTSFAMKSRRGELIWQATTKPRNVLWDISVAADFDGRFRRATSGSTSVRNRFDWGSNAIATTGSVQFGGRAISYGNVATAERRLSPSLVYLIDGDRLLELDLRARTLRTIHESTGLLAVAITLEPRESTPRTATNQAAADAADVTTNVGADADDGSKAVTRIALRTAEAIILLDPPTSANRE